MNITEALEQLWREYNGALPNYDLRRLYIFDKATSRSQSGAEKMRDSLKNTGYETTVRRTKLGNYITIGVKPKPQKKP